ncbi:hypothetical protein RE476_05045 [Methanolobus mangrovi]|uniref:Uncharacterized protein n=1 Tax=Methanolobus mangrovi TaxID=3072977 RepID=A0AA51UHX7_9EURY|nr:hypothetical protein [Methanolobus mangrovi]WMW23199.1 hypothetical protein RE476_05045 [Methanolobus mangrovi]
MIIEYANHPEPKFDGDVGILERRHVYADSVIYIGKESNNIEEQALDVKKLKNSSTNKRLWIALLICHKLKLKLSEFLGTGFRESSKG